MDLKTRLRAITYVLVLILGMAITMLAVVLYAHRYDLYGMSVTAKFSCPSCGHQLHVVTHDDRG